MIPPKTQDKPDWNRRRFLRTAAGAAAALPTLRALGQQTSSTPLDITFYQVGDPHYRAFETTSGNHNSLVRTALRKMGELTASTPMPGAGTIGAAQAVLNVGDLLDSGTETNPTTGLSIGKLATLEGQWTNYTADFGLLGNEPNTLVKLPVYETYGNHDQDGFLKQICDRIAARAAQLPGITAKSGTYTYQGAYGNISITGVHYAWKMGPIHFVQTNLRVGDGPERLPSSGSYSFLKSYLEGQVGSSGAPVFVIVHLPPTTAAEEEWPKADRQRFYDLIRRFNVVGILVGHTHAYDFFDWRGPDNNGDVPIPVYQCDCLYKGSLQGMFNVFRIVGDALDPNKATVHMAQRMRNDVWGKSASRVISLAAAAPPPGPGPGAETGALKLLQWQSMNLHGLETYGLTIPQGDFVEPRQGGVQQLEMLFDRAITLVTATSLLSVSGVTAGGKRSLADCGLSVVATLDSTGKRVSVRFASTGPARLPDASKWRFTVNPAAIRGVDGSSLSASADTTRVISALVGDYNADGRVNALDLNEIGNTTAFDPEIVNCIRADINGDGVIDSSDVAAAWANRNQATTGLVLL
jgi:hypothetical protein